MKFRRIAIHRANHRIRGLAGIGLVGFAAMQAPFTLAENAPKAASAPKAVQPSKAEPKTPAWPAECARTGQRVVAALARDDSGAANQFYSFYTVFKCSQQQLAQSFGCLVKLQDSTPGLTNPSPEQVVQCWDDPSTVPVVESQPPATPSPEGEKKK